MGAVVAMDSSGCGRGYCGWSSLFEEKKDAVRSLSLDARKQAGVIYVGTGESVDPQTVSISVEQPQLLQRR